MDNTEKVLEYLSVCRKTLSERKQVEFDLSKIQVLTPDAIALLIANVKDVKNFTHGLNVRGINPDDKELRKMFVSSGFLDHVSSGTVTGGNNESLLIHKITDKKVENDIAKRVCELAVAHSFGQAVKFSPIYEVLIECMANTNNHAGLDRQGIYNWWILVYHNPKTKITSFSFLDLGAGIFNSLPVQNHWKKLLTSVRDTTTIDVVPKYNTDLLPNLFAGEIFLTRTGEKNRGKGLPLIYNHSKNALIKNFTIISNDVYVRIPEFESKNLDNKFQGTFLYWELHPKN